MKKYVPKKANNLFSTIQTHLYKTLQENPVLARDLKILNQIPKDTAYPYIYIGRFSVINSSTKQNPRMHFVNEIFIYSQDHSVSEILEWSNEIKSSMQQQRVFLKKCHIVESDFLQMNLDIMPDSKIHRAAMKFRIIVEELDGVIQRKPSAA